VQCPSDCGVVAYNLKTGEKEQVGSCSDTFGPIFFNEPGNMVVMPRIDGQEPLVLDCETHEVTEPFPPRVGAEEWVVDAAADVMANAVIERSHDPLPPYFTSATVVRLFRASTLELLATHEYSGESGTPQMVLDSRQHLLYVSLLYGNGGYGKIAVLDSHTLEELDMIEGIPSEGDSSYKLAINARHGRLYVTNKTFDRVRVIDTESHELMNVIDIPNPYGLVVAKKSGYAYVRGNEQYDPGQAFVIDRDGELQQVIDTPHAVIRIAVNQWTGSIYMATSGGIQVVEPRRHNVIQTLDFSARAFHIAAPRLSASHLARPKPIVYALCEMASSFILVELPFEAIVTR